MLSIRILASLGLLFCLPALLTDARAEPGADHPEVARYPSAVMMAFDFKEYEEAQLLLSRPVQRAGEFTADKLMPLEGRVTFIRYELPKSVSALQIFRNHQSALRRSGFKDLFVCERPCTSNNIYELRKLMKLERVSIDGDTDNQYLAAQRGDTYVSMWVNVYGSQPQVWLTVVEKGSLDTEMIAISGTSPIAKALNEQGRVDVYGFQFDTGRAQLKAASQATLKELAQTLQDNPALQITLVGHTDDVGGAEANMKLSEARARAVAEALTLSAGVAPDRLSARGAGQTLPLAPNTDEVGRAKNRRVEVIAAQAAAAVTAAKSTSKDINNPRPNVAAAKPAVQMPAPAAPAVEDPMSSSLEKANKLIEAANKLRGLFGR